MGLHREDPALTTTLSKQGPPRYRFALRLYLRKSAFICGWASRNPTHSLTEPEVIPATMNFWHNKKTMVMGRPPNTARAENVPQSFSCS